MIANFDYPQTLYNGGLDFTYDKDNSMIFLDETSGPFNKNVGVWVLEKVPNTGHTIRIRTKVPGEYLYAGNDQQAVDVDRRNIFIWKGAPRNPGTFFTIYLFYLWNTDLETASFPLNPSSPPTLGTIPFCFGRAWS